MGMCEGWWFHPAEVQQTVNDGSRGSKVVDVGMHYVGRRWGDINGVYHTEATFESYGVDVRDERMWYQKFSEKVPEEHKDFLRNLKWVVEIKQSYIESDGTVAERDLIFVHAGLDRRRPVDAQLEALRAQDLFSDQLHAVEGEMDQIMQLSSKSRNVKQPHPEHSGTATVVVSGHHDTTRIDQKNRVIMDHTGGKQGMPNMGVIFKPVYWQNEYETIQGLSADERTNKNLRRGDFRRAHP